MTTKAKVLKHPHQTTAKPHYTIETLTAMRDYHQSQVNHLDAVETRCLKELYDCRRQLRYHTQQVLALQDKMAKKEEK